MRNRSGDSGATVVRGAGGSTRPGACWSTSPGAWGPPGRAGAGMASTRSGAKQLGVGEMGERVAAHDAGPSPGAGPRLSYHACFRRSESPATRVNQRILTLPVRTRTTGAGARARARYRALTRGVAERRRRARSWRQIKSVSRPGPVVTTEHVSAEGSSEFQRAPRSGRATRAGPRAGPAPCLAQEAEIAGGAAGEVDDPPLPERAAVVDPHHHAAVG